MGLPVGRSAHVFSPLHAYIYGYHRIRYVYTHSLKEIDVRTRKVKEESVRLLPATMTVILLVLLSTAIARSAGRQVEYI
jgi:hypothetical protein